MNHFNMDKEGQTPRADFSASLEKYFDKRGKFLADVIRADVESLRLSGEFESQSAFATGLDLSERSVRGRLSLNEQQAEITGEPNLPLVTVDRLPAPQEGDDSSSKSEQDPLVDIHGLLLRLVEEQTGYPQDTLSIDLRLLDDLNLDSIKAGELVARAAKELGVSGNVDPTQLANASLADVASTLAEQMETVDGISRTTGSEQTRSDSLVSSHANQQSDYPEWVRNFVVEYHAEPSSRREVTDWSEANVLLVSDPSMDKFCDGMAQLIETFGGHVQRAVFEQLDPETLGEHTHYLACLPQGTELDTAIEDKFRRMISRQRSIATPATSTAVVGFIQFGGGSFGRKTVVSPEACCAAGFAKSLHLERPDLQIRVVDLSTALPSQQAVMLALAEMTGSESIITVGYDAKGIRLAPRIVLQQPVDYAPRQIRWEAQDVVLVTGGAKGITAECALAFAKDKRVQMALIGRSPAPTDGQGEIAQTLSRFAAEGLTCRYYPCDISDLASVQQTVAAVQQDLGSITGVVHGAGLNTPRRVEQVSLQDAASEIAPKLLGAQNLIAALADAPPKIFAALSSIIGVTGMPGNCWYAFANESLDLLLNNYHAQHPQTQVVSMAYSVWSEVGMGARMGSVDGLARMGIDAIPTSEGVGRFMTLMDHDPGALQVVIAARLGGLDTWNRHHETGVSEFRFIEDVKYFEPGVALVAEAHLTVERDLYVQDHIWRGSHLFPTVFGIEAMAQAVAFLTDQSDPSIIRLEDIALERPVVVDPQDGVGIQLHATVLENKTTNETSVRVGIRTELTGFKSDHFSATFVIGQRLALEKSEFELAEALDVEVDKDFYGKILFQGPLFQKLQSVHALSREYGQMKSTVASSSELGETGFASGQGGRLVLGDPFFRDVLLHVPQLNIPQDISLPVRISQIQLGQNPAHASGERTIQVALNERDGQEYDCDVIVTNSDDEIVERLVGYRLRILEEYPENPSAADIAHPEARDRQILNTKISSLVKAFHVEPVSLDLIHQPQLGKLPRDQRRLHQVPLVRKMLQQHLSLDDNQKLEFQLKAESSGKPILEGVQVDPFEVSISHDAHYCIASVGVSSQGCDIEPIVPRRPEDWRSLLGNQRFGVAEALAERDESLDVSAMRVWTATEAVIKASQTSDFQLTKIDQHGEAFLLQTRTGDQDYTILTFPVNLTRELRRMVSLVVVLNQDALESANASWGSELTDNDMAAKHADIDESLLPYISIDRIIAPESHLTRVVSGGPQGQPVFEHRFQAGFRQSCSVSRKVTVSQFVSWVAKMREMPLRSIAPKMLEDFMTGKWGLVTNTVSLSLMGEATTYDTIHTRCWMGNWVDSTFTGYIEFCKVLQNGELERIALSEITSTFVEMKAYGVPAPAPFPDYLSTYLKCFATERPTNIDFKQNPSESLHPLPEPLSDISVGDRVWENTSVHLDEKDAIASEVFQTTQEESNVVGNVYFGNYFIWQGRLVDLFLHDTAPQYLRATTSRGEILPLFSDMLFLREAMPFDKVCVRMFARSVYTCGADFEFEFYRKNPDGSLDKLQTGQQRVVWAKRNPETGQPYTQPWPKDVLTALLQNQTDDIRLSKLCP